MKIYKVVLEKGNETRVTYCDYRPRENEIFVINGERWIAVCWF